MPTPALETTQPAARNYSVLEAAAFLRISRASIYRLIAEGRLKSLKIGRRSIILGADLARLVAPPQP